MLIGVPKEIKTQEYSVGLVPGSVRELVPNGKSVLVEAGARVLAMRPMRALAPRSPAMPPKCLPRRT
jgi:NAD/NADP transhydrogenase alpha subunit